MVELQTLNIYSSFPSLQELRRSKILIIDLFSSDASRFAAFEALLFALRGNPYLRRRSLAVLSSIAYVHPTLVLSWLPSLRPLLLTRKRVASEALSVLISATSCGGALSLDKELALSLTSSHSVAVRTRLLDLLLVDARTGGEFGGLDRDFVISLFLCFSGDLYPFVRIRALDGLASLCDASSMVVCGVMTKVYGRCVGCLLDEDAEVRLAAIRLMSAWGQMLVAGCVEGLDVDLLSDLIFVQLCSMTRDMDMKVRIEAFTALKKVKVVSESMLLQSLSKKAIRTSNAGCETSEHAMHLIESPKISISSAAGAFVHGLEDEFYEVREAACISLGMLSIQFARFADGALKLLMGMLNDDRMEVKLRKLQTFLDMTRYGHLTLQGINAHMFLSMLIDVSSSIRHGARKVVCIVPLFDMKIFESLVLILLTSLERYPQDEEDIFCALFHVSKNHGNFAAQFMEGSTPEMDTTNNGDVNLDKAQVAAFILIVLGAHFSYERISFHIPQKVLSHAISFLGRISTSLRRLVSHQDLLAYLCHKSSVTFSPMKMELKEKEKTSESVCQHMLDCTNSLDSRSLRCPFLDKISKTLFDDNMVASIKCPGSAGQSKLSEVASQDAKQTIVLILKMAAKMWPLITSQCSSEVLRTLRDYRKQVEIIVLDRYSCNISCTAFAILYIQVIQLITASWVYFSSRNACILGVNKLDILLSKLDCALNEIRFAFVGYSWEEEVHILELTLLCCVSRLHGVGFCMAPLWKRMQAIISRLDELQRDPQNISSFVKELKNVFCQIENSKNPSLIPVGKLLNLFSFRGIQFSGMFKHIKAEINSPENDSYHPLLFVAGLPVGIPLHISLYNVSKDRRVWLKMVGGESSQNVLLDLHQFDGTEEVRSCAIDAPFYGAPRAVMFVLKVTVIMECLSEYPTRLERGKGGPRYETAMISKSKDIYLINKVNK